MLSSIGVREERISIGVEKVGRACLPQLGSEACNGLDALLQRRKAIGGLKPERLQALEQSAEGELRVGLSNGPKVTSLGIE